MKTIKVIFENGDYLYTKINGTKEEIKNYFIGRIFNVGTVKDDLRKCINVEILYNI